MFFQLCDAITHILALLTTQTLAHMCRYAWGILQNMSFRTEDINGYPTRCNLQGHG